LYGSWASALGVGHLVFGLIESGNHMPGCGRDRLRKGGTESNRYMRPPGPLEASFGSHVKKDVGSSDCS
jgi:hypothetical protein